MHGGGRRLLLTNKSQVHTYVADQNQKRAISSIVITINM